MANPVPGRRPIAVSPDEIIAGTSLPQEPDVMDHEHKRQLQQNELLKLGQKANEFLHKDFWDKYSNPILIGITVVCLLLAGWIYWSRRTRGAETRAWKEVLGAAASVDYVRVAEDFSGTKAAPWANLKAAELRLSDGIRKMFTDREGAPTDLEQARTRLEDLAASAPEPRIRERAAFLLAQCLETQGKVKEAIDRYQALLKDFPETAYKDLAAERIDALKSPDAREFYAWFEKQKPKPEEAPKPKDESLPFLHPDLTNPPLDLTPPGKSMKKLPEEKTTEEPLPEKKPASESKSDAEEKSALPALKSPEDSKDPEKKPEPKPEPKKKTEPEPEKKPDSEKTPEPEKRPE